MSHIPLNIMLRNMSNEIARLSAIAANVDHVMGDVVKSMQFNDAEHQSALQDVDLLRQSLDCLAVLLSNTADQQDVVKGVLSDVAGEGVYLRDLRDACLANYNSG